MEPKHQSLGSVLVTGGSGYLGEQIYLRLKELGASVRNLDLLPPPAPEHTADWHKADISQPLPQNLPAFQTVFHVAAVVPLARDKNKFRQVNAEGTRSLIEWSYRMGARQFIYMSSSAVFGREGAAGAILPGREPTPCEDYGRSKLQGEKYVQEFAREHPDMKVCIIRPRTLIGPGRLGIFEILFDWIRHDARVYILGSGENKLQFLHTEDLVEASILCAQNQVQGILNLGARNFLPLKEELQELCRYAGSKSKIQCLPLAFVRPALECADFLHLMPFSKWHYLTMDVDFYFDQSAEAALGGWQSRYSNQDALRTAYDWYVKNRENFTDAPGTLSIHKSKPDHRWLSLLKKISRRT